MSGTRAPLDAYVRASGVAARSVLQEYSGSVGTAIRLLSPRLRPPVAAVCALVRVADEIVDGAAGGAGLTTGDQRVLLDSLEEDTERALLTGYSTNVVVQAFAAAARPVGIGVELTRPFFASMRRDLDPAWLTSDELPGYIHGSTEVAGLMCLRIFLAGSPVPESDRRRLEAGARRLGAAGQKLDFLRDLPVDWAELGRNYLPGVDPDRMTESQKRALLADIAADLSAAAEVIPRLPVSCRRAIVAVHGLFEEIAARVAATPASELVVRRVSVPAAVKLRIAARAALGGRPRPGGT
ncbi:squalene/phytoene synthase family protein [Leifsonia sp. C5G2]|uniref:phytoene/squalene synthase family protein n=1 Tax=Leifsonia sp. C5G2 TaxID=2735269 RepID=UPI0032DE8697